MEASASVGWDFDVKSGRDVLFGDLQAIFGLPGDSYVITTEDFFRYVHPDDRTRVSEAIDDARQNQKLYAEEFRIVKPDGTAHWLAARGKFYYARDGSPERMIGVSMDITERKLAEEALAGMNRRVIEAEERERDRIARDLHENVGQRLALLAIAIEQLKNDFPHQAVELSGPHGCGMEENPGDIDRCESFGARTVFSETGVSRHCCGHENLLRRVRGEEESGD